MERGELKELFKSGDMPAGAEYKAALKDVLLAFPYFQLAQVFFAKQLYDANEPEAPGYIKLASIYAPDRKAMYHLFKKTSIGKINGDKEQIKPAKAAGENVKAPEKKEVKYNYVYSSTVSLQGAETKQKAEIAPEPVKKESEAASLSETFIRTELETKLPAITPPLKMEKPTEPPVKPVKEPYIKPVIEKKPEEKKTEPVVAKPLVTAKEEPAAIAQPIADTLVKHSFNDWLKALSETKEEVKPLSPGEVSGIIDNFLKKEPSISRPKAEFFSPVKAAKMSITEDDNLISETLADIFFKQGNLPKALKSYQTLLSQFPEKKSIFAARIEEIETLIRENAK